MKTVNTILLVVLISVGVFIPLQTKAQLPEKISYQAVIRDANNNLVTNHKIGMKISILQGSINGTNIYSETQTPTTNANGLVSIEIGGGTGFNTINWAAGPYFLKTETDINGGTNYTITGTSQLLSVPFALYAKTAESVSGTITESDPVFNSSDAAMITSTDIESWDNKLESFTETDPVYNASVAKGITQTDTLNWNNKLEDYSETDPMYSAWDKSTGINITESQISDLQSYLTEESDPVFGISIAAGITSIDTSAWNAASIGAYIETDPIYSAWDKSTGISITESQISDLQSYLTTETDPVYSASVASGITGADTLNWNNKLNSYTETDPLYNTSVASGITGADTLNWNNKLNSYTETDPVYSASVSSGITGTDTLNWNNKLDTEIDGSVTNEIQNLSQVLAQNNDAGGNLIKNIADPVDAQDAVTKAYVDAIVRQLSDKGILAADIDGNVYLTVYIGSQLWMGENLKTTHYADGTSIPLITDNTTWANLGDNDTNTAYCYYNNDENSEYGALYTWAAAMDSIASSSDNPSGIQGVCPDGWHLPSDAEWTVLTDYLAINYSGDEGQVLKSTSGWSSGNGTDNYNFNGLPGGFRDSTNGTFSGATNYSYWWSTTEDSVTSSWTRNLQYDLTTCQRTSENKSSGFAVRCIKD